MRLLDKLVLKDLLPMFWVGVALFAALWFAADPVLAASRYLASGVPVALVIQLVGLSLPQILGLTFPMGVLLAALVGFGRLSSDGEAVALFASGIPFLRIAAPAAVLGLVVSGVGYVINDRVASAANRRIADLKEHSLHELGETAKPFNFENRPNNVLQLTVHVEKGFDLRARPPAMRDVTIVLFDAHTGRPTVAFHAARAEYERGKSWRLLDVEINRLGMNMAYSHQGEMETYELGKTPDNVAFLQRDPASLTFADLSRQISELKAAGMGNSDDVRNAEVELWSKVALPFAALIFAMVGAPLGLRPQRTARYTGWILSIGIIFSYYVLYTALSSLARGGYCPPPLAAFLPNIIGFVAGVGLIWKASI